MTRLLSVISLLTALAALPYACYLVVYTLLRDKSSPANKRQVEPTITVVIPTYNEASIIETKLEDIVEIDYPMEKVEVLLVDASDDTTIEVAQEFFSGLNVPDLTVLHEDERRGVATAVNEAVANATGELIFRTDADSKLDPGVFREAAANLADPSIGVVTGRQTQVLGNSTVESNYRNLLTLVQVVESSINSTFIVHGPCSAFRRDEYVSVSADTIADDTAFALAIRRTGKRVVMDPTMAFAESSVSSYSRRRTRKDRRAKGLLQLLWRNTDMLGRYGAFGRVILPINWWFMIVSPWLLMTSVALTTLAGLILAGPAGLLIPIGLVAYTWLGQRDALGPLGILYAFVDSQVSLWLASVDLLTDSEGSDGMWTIDRESREVFK